jgi:hypothetical protein
MSTGNQPEKKNDRPSDPPAQVSEAQEDTRTPDQRLSDRYLSLDKERFVQIMPLLVGKLMWLGEDLSAYTRPFMSQESAVKRMYLQFQQLFSATEILLA